MLYLNTWVFFSYNDFGILIKLVRKLQHTHVSYLSNTHNSDSFIINIIKFLLILYHTNPFFISPHTRLTSKCTLRAYLKQKFLYHPFIFTGDLEEYQKIQWDSPFCKIPHPRVGIHDCMYPTVCAFYVYSVVSCI